MSDSLTPEDILLFLPYSEPFLFVDQILDISEEGVKGSYSFNKNAFFYKGHFKDNPVTPGVIITECMAQIGLVCLGIYLFKRENKTEKPSFFMSHNEIDYFLPVLPGEKVIVVSEKVYFRFNKLKCKVKMVNAKNELIAKGFISGMANVENKRSAK